MLCGKPAASQKMLLRRKVSGIMLTSLLMGFLALANGIYVPRVERTLDDEIWTLTLPSIRSDEGGNGEDLGVIGLNKMESEGQHSSGFWVPFVDARLPRAPLVEVLESNEQECIISITISGMYEEIAELEGNVFQKLTIPDVGFIYEPGKPRLPAIRGFVEIPPGKTASLKVMDVRSSDLFGYMVYPSQNSTLDPRETADDDFLFDQAFYCLDAYYPDITVSISSPAQLRDHTLVQLSVYPIQFNPVVNRLRVSTTVKVELEFSAVAEVDLGILDRLYSPAFEKISRTIVLNHESSACTNTDMEYLIISHDEFYPSMTRFVEWKKLNRLQVTSVKLSDIASNAKDTDIYNYIRNAFFNWTLPPTYVLLVGDVEYVPVHIEKLVPDVTGWPLTPTDHYYACVYGDDFFPDIFVGRLSVKNITELNNVLDKLVSYRGFFNKKATLIDCGYPGYSDVACAYAKELLVAEGYSVEMLSYLTDDATTANIIEAVNDGRSIVCYDGHGGVTEWNNDVPPFYISDVYNLTNEGNYPIIYSGACLTGNYLSNCLGEAWMKAPRKGAVAFFGSSRIAEAPRDCLLAKGFFKAMFMDDLDEFGPATVAAKLYMYNHIGEDPVYGNTPWCLNHTKAHFYIYNILTDPQLDTCMPVRDLNTSLGYVTIQEAINSDKTVNGHTIFVEEGTYCEHVVVNKSISLVGERRATTIIDANGTGTAVKITANTVSVRNFTIQQCGPGPYPEYGVEVSNCVDVTISENNFLDNPTKGVFLYYAVNCTITENLMNNNTCGAWLTDSIGNTVTRNNVENCSNRGIALVSLSSNNVVAANVLSCNDPGLYLEWAYENLICENTISNATFGRGIEVWNSHNNTIFHNNFIDNADQVHLDSSFDNVWDNGCEGNYWSNYNGTDFDGDGVGDTYLPWEGIDHYPLMNAFIKGDINHDLKVDICDLVLAGAAYGSTSSDSNWNPHCDIAEPYDVIDKYDLIAVCACYGSKWCQMIELNLKIPGDVDGDFDVDIIDIVKITGIYGSKRGDSEFQAKSDIDGDGQITILDLVICSSHYGQHFP